MTPVLFRRRVLAGAEVRLSGVFPCLMPVRVRGIPLREFGVTSESHGQVVRAQLVAAGVCLVFRVCGGIPTVWLEGRGRVRGAQEKARQTSEGEGKRPRRWNRERL